jgi:hypothetical protein
MAIVPRTLSVFASIMETSPPLVFSTKTSGVAPACLTACARTVHGGGDECAGVTTRRNALMPIIQRPVFGSMAYHRRSIPR